MRAVRVELPGGLGPTVALACGCVVTLPWGSPERPSRPVPCAVHGPQRVGLVQGGLFDQEGAGG